MILWSTKKDGPWTAFQSSARIFPLLKDNYPTGTGNGNLWLPRRGFKRNALNTINLQELVEEVLKKPNEGPEDERFELDLKKISELIKSGEFYTCGAGRRTLLDPSDERIGWSGVQKAELCNLRKLLHPKFLASTQEKLVPAARVVQAVFYATEKKQFTAIEQAVLWRLSHLYPVLSFCELIVALGLPKQDSQDAPSVLGAVVAAKSALELTAHFVVGGTNNNCDPFDDATGFKYTQTIEDLGKTFDDWKGASGWYDELSDVIKLKKPVNEKIIETCRSVLQLVCKIPEFQKPITASGETIVLMEFGAKRFKAPKENYAVLTYRTDFDPCPWPLGADTIDHSMSWTGINSPRLEALGFTEVNVFDSPNLVDSAELLERLKGFKTDGAEPQKVEAAISLVRAFCICHNLGNIVALGAIARELHLVVERLTVTQKLDERRDLKALDEAKEDDKSLKCIASGLTKELNIFRAHLQDILASFAHPGWLIRTELLRVKDDKDSSTQALFITANYAPHSMGGVKPVDGYRTSVELISTTSSAKSHFSQVIMNFPQDLRRALTGDPNGVIESGEAIDVPFVAFILCQKALFKILDKP